MTDAELLSRVLSCIDPSAHDLRIIRRNGRILLRLPTDREAFARALALYQPQRPAARAVVTILRGLSKIGSLGCVLPKIKLNTISASLSPPLPGIAPESCGILLGSPEHRVRRAIASYCHLGKWEVAKISFGTAGASNLVREARVLEQIGSMTDGVPDLLGLHLSEDMTVLRMPYLSGAPIKPGNEAAALQLLERWISDQAAKPANKFPEWIIIESALAEFDNGLEICRQLSVRNLVPVICHGDFARWNLRRQADGRLMALDWEWGRADGMPGLDLVHYFLQDSRLVERLSPADAITKTCAILESSACRDYLRKTGWNEDPILLVIASLAYKQGAGHQENVEFLKAAVARSR